MITNLLNAIGLLVLRVAFGALMLFGHGLPKLMQFSERSEKFPDPLGIGNSVSLALAIIAELGCSALLILGLGTRLVVLPLAFTMIVAASLVHANDPWQTKEKAVLYLTVYATLLITGGGSLSLDRLISWKRKSTTEGQK